MKWIYPQLIDDLKYYCNKFINGDIDIQIIQNKIYKTEMQIVSIEEQWLRKILSNIENEIELSMFTLEDAELKKNVREKIDNLLDILYKFENDMNYTIL